MKNILKFDKGQSLFEVVVAVSISALIITAIVAVVSNSIQGSSYSRDKTLAANYIQQTMEWLKQERGTDADNLESKILAVTETTGLSYCLTTNSSWPDPTPSCHDVITDTKFTRILEFNSYQNSIAHLRVTVSWQDSKGLHEVSSSTDLMVK